MGYNDVDAIFDGSDDDDDDVFGDVFAPQPKTFGNSQVTPPHLRQSKATRTLSIGTLAHLLNTCHQVRNVPRHTGISRAVFEFVDQLSSGQVTAHAAFYEAESTLVSLHLQKTILRSCFESLVEYDYTSNEELITLADYIVAQMEIIDFAIERAAHSYSSLGADYGLPIDQSIIFNGLHEQVTPIIETTSGNPLGINHHRYGPMDINQPFQIKALRMYFSMSVEFILAQSSPAVEEIFS